MASYPELAERVVAITGAAQGIGAAAARAFGAQRARVALLDIDEKGMAQVAGEIRAEGGRALAARCDVTDEKSVAQAVEKTVAELGGLDVLVNCAGGYGRIASVEDMPLEEWDRTVALNLRSAFLCARAAIPHLKRSRAGRILNVASISGRAIASTTSPAYAAAKAGMIQLTRFLAQELGPSGVTANAIAPITTLTPRVLTLRTKEEFDRIAAQVPLRRLPSPEEHAEVLLFLASDSARYLNGVTLDVNGGRVMM
ncbi:MAG TPA: SDR family NAD(P)-dependent oxidoreductase [Burkholderiales bacterium]|nr:SDR family NAD(P)-dependent oxidoreductase [Burkholderiales bacterium]